MASPPKNDAWRAYQPHEQRVVFIKRQGALKPYLGLVLEFPVTGNGNRFLVAYVEEGLTRSFRIDRFERRQLVPIEIDPNWMVRAPGRR